MGGNLPGENYLGGNFPRGNSPGGSLMGRNFPGGSFSYIHVENIHKNWFMVWNSIKMDYDKVTKIKRWKVSIHGSAQ